MTELSALHVRLTGDNSGLEAALNRAETGLTGFAATAVRTQAQTSRLGGAMGTVAQRFNGARGSIQQVAFQLQDMAVQLQAGTSASVVFAQQGSQIASIFGPVGAIIGALAAVGLPALAFAFANGATQAKGFEDSLSGLKDVTDRLNTAQEILKTSLPELYEQYGIYAGRVREAAAALVELQNAEAQQALSQLIIDNAEALDLFTGSLSGVFTAGEQSWVVLNRLQEQFGITRDQADALRTAFRDLRFADDFQAQSAALARIAELMRETGISAEQLPPALRQALIQYNEMTIAGAELTNTVKDGEAALIAMTGAAPGAGWLGGAISDAATLAETLWDAAIAKAAALSEGGGMAPASGEYDGGPDAFRRTQQGGAIKLSPSGAGMAYRPSAGGGGGGGLSSQLQSEIEAMQEALMTQEQLQAESFARQQEMLSQALAQRLITQEEYQNLMQQAQATHDFAMTQSVNKGVTDTLNALGSLFQGSKKIGAAVALANSWVAFTEVLKDPAYIGRPWARIAAAGQALAAGLNAVRNIRSASPGGAGGGGASGAGISQAPQQNVQTLNFTVQNDSFGIGSNLIRQIAMQLNQAQRNGSTLIRATVS